ncbi:hypothetical protein HDV00_007378 [Rhizophlyctis rosea]|nr:hypothetical protein HDV00_007378 [Rhizophlyctis rosea]
MSSPSRQSSAAARDRSESSLTLPILRAETDMSPDGTPLPPYRERIIADMGHTSVLSCMFKLDLQILENEYCNNRDPSPEDMNQISTCLRWPITKVVQWFKWRQDVEHSELEDMDGDLRANDQNGMQEGDADDVVCMDEVGGASPSEKRRKLKRKAEDAVGRERSSSGMADSEEVDAEAARQKRMKWMNRRKERKRQDGA